MDVVQQTQCVYKYQRIEICFPSQHAKSNNTIID